METQLQTAVGVIDAKFDAEFVPVLSEFISIPNLSKAYDKDWETNGLLEQAAKLCTDYAEKSKLEGLKLETIKHPGRSPLIYGEIQPFKTESKKSILLYGHFDKQPHFEGWFEGLHPTKPVIKDGRLYGRGGADDGYAFFSCIMVLKAIQEAGLSHARIILLFEGDEESSSGDLTYYFHLLMERIGSLDLLVCLDSGSLDYEHMMITSTLRGVVGVNLRVQTASVGVHSGDGSGIIPDSTRVLRHLLDRVEDSKTGVVVDDFHVTIPPESYKDAYDIQEIAWNGLISQFPKVPGSSFTSEDHFTAYMNRAWKPQLTITGADGFPSTSSAGNVIRPYSTFKLSLRLPPTLDGTKASQRLVEILTTNPPYGAKVTATIEGVGSGWKCLPYPEPLNTIINDSAVFGFEKKCVYGSEGGSIPFIGELQQLFPSTSLLVVGVLGPENGAHGPNEMLDLAYTKKLQKSLLYILSKYL